MRNLQTHRKSQIMENKNPGILKKKNRKFSFHNIQVESFEGIKASGASRGNIGHVVVKIFIIRIINVNMRGT